MPLSIMSSADSSRSSAVATQVTSPTNRRVGGEMAVLPQISKAFPCTRYQFRQGRDALPNFIRL